MFKKLYESHQRLKHKIHNTRIPLSKNGQRFMMLVYITTPIVIGSIVMDKVVGVSDKNWGLVKDENGNYVANKYSLPENSSLTAKEFEYNKQQSRESISKLLKSDLDLYKQKKSD